VHGSLGRTLRVTALAAVALAICVLAGVGLGVEHVDFGRALADRQSVDGSILSERGLRVLLGVLVGAALAPSGVAFQALLRNPLADPYVLGVAGGAAVTGTGAIVLGLGAGLLGAATLPVWAFGGAVAAVAFVFAAGHVRGRLAPNVALLAGVVLNALSGALVVFIRLWSAPDKAHQALYWLTGSLAMAEPWQLPVLAAYTLVGNVLLLWLAVPLNALALGEELAHSSGVDIERTRRLVFIAASLLTGAAVAFAGPIGFVGIVVPHTLRAILGPDHRALLPASALIGGGFVVLADTVARLLLGVFGTEPTVGVVTALLGAPFFLAILRGRGGERVF
jgi:iron complex transport system permease protein